MPLRNAPSKLKVVAYLTPVEKIATEAKAKVYGTTLSEYLRMLVIRDLSTGPQAQPIINADHHLPTGRELLKDFIFGDVPVAEPIATSPDTDLDNG